MAMQTDPVCGMQVDEQKAQEKSQFEGRTYYFCSEDCKIEFDQQPEEYAVKTAQKGGQAKSSGSSR